MAALTIQYHAGGVWLPELDLWLDPHTRQTGPERVFVSHAHSDHTASHREVILSKPTARLMRARVAGERMEHTLPFGQPKAFGAGSGRFRITLLPAGHVLGSAMALIEARGQRLLYTGDFKLRRSLAAEPCDPGPAYGCDVLVIESTFGRPEYRLPPVGQVTEAIIGFCRETLAGGGTPVLLAYSLGKSQELLCLLAGCGLPVALHPAVWKITEVYAQCGVRFPPHERLDLARTRGKVLLCPPASARAATLQQLRGLRTAIISGWAMETRCRYRYGTDAAFALSDHADFPELVEFVQRVRPRQVLTVHGFAADFARALRRLGFDARALSEDEQLILPGMEE